MLAFALVGAVDHTDTTSATPSQSGTSTKTSGAISASGEVYLRPETAQGMFVNFAQIQKSTRK